MIDYNQLQQQYMVNTYPNRGVTFVRGDGIYLIDQFGEKYLDMMTNYGVNIFGYNHPKITAALIYQLQQLTTLHGSFTNDVRAQASKALVEQCGENYAQVYFSNSGAEAIEAALKFAVLQTGKRKFIVCNNGYHGKTLGALSATSGEKYKKPFEPLLWKFVQIPFNNIQALNSAVDDQVTGFIVEPIQGEGGIFIPDKNYLKEVQEICSKKGILLIVDEIQTGCGRTGTFLASQEISADIVCLGKGLAGGIPVGATIINKKVSEVITKNIHTSTFGANPLACAGVLVTLDLLSKRQLGYIQEIGKYFIHDLQKIHSEHILQVRGKGLMIGIEVKEKRNDYLKRLQQEKILAIPAGENIIRLLPPYVIEKKDIDNVIKSLRKILNLSS